MTDTTQTETPAMDIYEMAGELLLQEEEVFALMSDPATDPLIADLAAELVNVLIDDLRRYRLAAIADYNARTRNVWAGV